MTTPEHCTPIRGLASIFVREGEHVLYYVTALTFSRSQLAMFVAQLKVALADPNADPRTIRRLQHRVAVHSGAIAVGEALSPGHVMAYELYGGDVASLKASDAYSDATKGLEQSQIDEFDATIDGMFE